MDRTVKQSPRLGRWPLGLAALAQDVLSEDTALRTPEPRGPGRRGGSDPGGRGEPGGAGETGEGREGWQAAGLFCVRWEGGH